MLIGYTNPVLKVKIQKPGQWVTALPALLYVEYAFFTTE